MPILSPGELLQWLGQFQFLTPAQLDEFRPLLSGFADTMAVAKELIRRDWLTPYQVNQIMLGKHEQLVVNEYRLRERIGEGAMGQVFKAWSPKLGRVVAVKAINKELINNDKAMERFRREAEAASQLHHPNIAQVREAGEADGRPYMVMEFIDGVDLSRRVKLHGALPIHEAVEYVRQGALGLQHAYDKSIVHRDIKPANLIVTSMQHNGDSFPLVKILDFGLARIESDDDDGNRLTQVGKLLGTIDYVAPEQATNARSADIRSDLYSLGCTLYYLLTAQAPFQGKDMIERLGPRVTGEPPWVRTLRPEAAPGLEEVLRRMMARRPEDRYQTPIEAAQALEPYTQASAHASAPIALAQPVTGPVVGGVALATPIFAGDVPLAAPVSEVPQAPADPSFYEMSSTGRDMSTGAVPPAKPAARKGPPVKLLVMIGGTVFLLGLVGCLGFCLLSYFKAPKKSDGTLVITKATISVITQKLEPGHSKFVLVWIERHGFRGPVKISLADLPEGVTSGTRVIPESGVSGDVSITVSYLARPVKTQIRVHAECEAEGISADLRIPLEILPKKN